MRGRAFLLGAAAVVLAAGIAVSQEEQKKEAPQDAMMAAIMPNENHARLKQLEGTWDTESRFVMEPGKPPEVGKGHAVNKMVLGGRFVQIEYHGGMQGQPFEGLGMIGYDNVAKEYVSTWADTMGTMILIERGSYDAKENALVMHSEFDAPDGSKQKMKTMTRFGDGKKYSYEMYGVGADGKEMKLGEVIYTKK